MLGLHLISVTLHRQFTIIFSKTNRIGDTVTVFSVVFHPTIYI
jgi:hypothetical protein